MRTPSFRILQFFVLAYISFGLANLASAQVTVISLTADLKTVVREKHGRRASNRIARWEALIQEMAPEMHTETTRSALRRINNFFNRIPFQEDIQTWHQEDYWATPIETLIQNAADCDDYTIGKYFTLRALGIPDSALRLIYVSKEGQQEPHMVLTYLDETLKEPLVMDNLTSRIQPASERDDLKAVYSFNAENLWLSENQSLLDGRLLGTPQSLAPWSDMLGRLP